MRPPRMVDPGHSKKGVASFQRVLVVLDTAASSEATLQTAASVAAATACELTGLFIEDQDLLHLAALPFARETQLSKAITRTLEPERLQRDLRAQATLARTAIAKHAAEHHLSWSFQVVHGRTEEQILVAAGTGDIIAIARRVGPLAQSGQAGLQARSIAARAPGPLIIAGGAAETAQPGIVLLPYDASAAAARMLGIASDFAQTRGVPLEIMLLGEAAQVIEDIHEHIRAVHGKTPHPSLRVWIPRDQVTAFHRLCELHQGLLVLPADAPWFRPGQIEQIIEKSQAPILLQTDLAP